MKRRCLSPSCPEYSGYGGRGITVCAEWMEYAAFIRDMGPRTSDAHSLERKNNDLGYCKTNCEWATKDVQVNNTRRNHRITYKGETLTMAQWARRTGISKHVLFDRVTRNGWSAEAAIETPVAPKTRDLTFQGRTLSVTGWAQELGVPPNLLFKRLEQGWSVEDALTRPATPKTRDIEFGGKVQSIAAWAREIGVHCDVIFGRLRRGWSVERALSEPIHENQRHSRESI